ncbi:XisH family protein [Fischerella thermalis]|uniref:XisH family protein n=1 Tax=Fischerella thermalis TaxID=372787 RepID=UPI0021558DB3|nr:XisH family protein [Fischerella thermalis]
MSARDLFHKAVKNELQKEDWIVTDDPLEIEFEEVTEQGKSKNLMELRNKMDWLPSIDLSHLWKKRKPKKPVGDIFVLDLINSKLLEGQDFAGLSREDADNKREEKIRNQIDLALNLLDKTTVLVIYIDGFSKEVKTLATRVDYYYVAANTSITLIGIVADSAYVAYGQHKTF